MCFDKWSLWRCYKRITHPRYWMLCDNARHRAIESASLVYFLTGIQKKIDALAHKEETYGQGRPVGE